MPIQGFVRLRRHQFGRQAAMGSKVGAVKAYPFKGVPTPDLTWTDPDVDTGSLDPVAAPYHGAFNLTASLNDSALEYNSLPLLHSAIFGGGVDPVGAGTSKTWTYAPASVAPLDDFDAHTYQFGDDVADDWEEYGDGILTSLEFSGPEGLGALTTSQSWRFGSYANTGSTDFPASAGVPTALSVDASGIKVYLKDMGIYIADTVAGLGAGQVVDALHSFTLRINREIDQKRFANASQSFDISAYGSAGRSIELECVFAKTADTVGTGSESDAWMSDDAVNRFVELKFTSTVMAEAAIPYSWDIVLPVRYYTRSHGEVGGNSTIVLTGHAFYDSVTVHGAITSTVVCTQGSIDGSPVS